MKPFLRITAYIGMAAFLLISGISASAQPAYDRDVRMRSLPPQEAVDFIEACGLTEKIRWFKEYEGNRISIEAKTRMHGREYSIEFDTLGNLKDVELRISFEDVSLPARSVIRNYLDTRFSKYRIVKTQYQWSGEKFALQKLITHQKTTQPHTTHYEVIVLGREKKSRKAYDLLFDQQGNLINIEEILPRNTDHLDF